MIYWYDCIQTDGCPSIEKAIKEEFPGASHGLCSFHMRLNLGRYGSRVVSLYKKAAYTYSRVMHRQYMHEIQSISPTAWKFLKDKGPKRWARSYCPVRRYEFMTSNTAESINSRLVWARGLPICSLLDNIRYMFQKWFGDRRTFWTSCDSDVAPKVAERILSAQARSQRMVVEKISGYVYNVKTTLHTHVVDLTNRSCTCLVFQTDLIPCDHALRALRYARYLLSKLIYF